MPWQDIATWLIVAAAFAYAAWMVYRTLTRKKSGGCGTSCGTGCATDLKSKPLVTLEPLDRSRNDP